MKISNIMATSLLAVALLLSSEIYALKCSHSQAYERDENTQPPREIQLENEAGDATSGIGDDREQEEASSSSSTSSSEGLASLSAGDVFVVLPNEEGIQQALKTLFPAVCLSFDDASLLKDPIIFITKNNQLALLHTNIIDDLGAQIVEEYVHNQDVRKLIYDGLHGVISNIIMRLAEEGHAISRALAERYAREMVADHEISVRLIFALLADYLQSPFLKLVAWNSFTSEEKEMHFSSVDESQEHPFVEEALPLVAEQQTGIRGIFKTVTGHIQTLFCKIRRWTIFSRRVDDNSYLVNDNEVETSAGKLTIPFYNREKWIETRKVCNFTQNELNEHLLDPSQYAVTRTDNPSLDFMLASWLGEHTGSFGDILTKQQIKVLQFLAEWAALDFMETHTIGILRVIKAKCLRVDCDKLFKKSVSFRNCFFESLNHLTNCSHLILRNNHLYLVPINVHGGPTTIAVGSMRKLIKLLKKLSSKKNLTNLTLRAIDSEILLSVSQEEKRSIIECLHNLNLTQLTLDINFQLLWNLNDSELRAAFEILRHLLSLTAIKFRQFFCGSEFSPEQISRFSQVIQGLKTLLHLKKIDVDVFFIQQDLFDLLQASLTNVKMKVKVI